LIHVSNAIAEDIENEVKMVDALRKKGLIQTSSLETAGKV